MVVLAFVSVPVRVKSRNKKLPKTNLHASKVKFQRRLPSPEHLKRQIVAPPLTAQPPEVRPRGAQVGVQRCEADLTSSETPVSAPGHSLIALPASQRPKNYLKNQRSRAL